MSVHLIREIQKLQKSVLSLGAMVEEALQSAVTALEERDVEIAESVVSGDRQIDLVELDVEEECLSILALHQPVAHDLRYVVAVMKINRDLERIGDLAANFASCAAALAAEPEIRIDGLRIREMAYTTQEMLKNTLDAFVNLDDPLAQRVRVTDDRIDEIHRNMYAKIEAYMRDHPDQISACVRLLVAARHLERMADHAVNIAKDVMYLVGGEIVRHRGKRSDGDQPLIAEAV